MDFNKNDVWTGIFVVATFFMVVGFTVYINYSRLLASTYPVKIDLNDIAGVEKGVEIVYRGYRAGAVSGVEIEYRPEMRFIVELSIRKEVHLFQGTKVLVRGKGFGGTKVLELLPPITKGPRIEAGAILPVASDKDLLVKANEVLSKVESVVLDFKKADTGAQLKSAIADGRAVLLNMDMVLKNLDGMIKENRSDVGQAVTASKALAIKTSEILAENQEVLKRILVSLDKSLIHLPDIMINVEEVTAEIKKHPWRLLRKGNPKEPAEVDHQHEPVKKP